MTYKPVVRTIGTRMHTLQHAMSLLIDLGAPQLCGFTPSQKDHPPRARLGDNIDDPLCELLPSMLRVAVGFVGADREAGVEKEDPTVSPGGEEAAPFGRRLETVGILDLEELVDIHEGRWRWGRGPHGEAEPVGLIEVVIGVLAYDDDFHGGEWRMARPAMLPSAT